MTAPSINTANATLFQDASSELSRTIPVPSDAANKVVYVWSCFDGVRTISMTGATYTAVLDDVAVYSGDHRATAALYRVEEGGSPPATYTLTIDGAERGAGVAWAVSDDNGVDNTPTPSEGESASASCPSVTPTENDTIALLLTATDDLSLPHGLVSGYTSIKSAEAASGGAVNAQYKTIATAAATGVNAVSMLNSAEWIGATVIIRGVAGGGGASADIERGTLRGVLRGVGRGI